MRPVKRGPSPQSIDFKNYNDAKPALISRISKGTFKEIHIASYCSYCERPINTNLAVEHIIPKDGDYGNSDLKGRWSNFLLACVNCNSCKSKKEVLFDKLFFPDRDNTFYAFEYEEDGTITPSSNLSEELKTIAHTTLSLSGLDKKIIETTDINGKLIATNRVAQRLEAWSIAKTTLEDYMSDPNNQALTNLTIKLMVSTGYFSIWMKVFENYPNMRIRFINAISGTKESGCFDSNSLPISPHPNEDNLPDGGKI